MRKLLLITLSATMLVGCYSKSELDEHKDAYQTLTQQVNAQANAAIDAANERVAEVEAQLDAANLDIAGLQSALSDLQQEKSNVEQALADSESDNAGLRASLENLNDTIADLESTIANLEAENAELSDIIAGLEAEIADLLANPIVITETVIEYIDRVVTVIETVEVEVERVIQVGGDTTALEAEIARLNGIIETLQTAAGIEDGSNEEVEDSFGASIAVSETNSVTIIIEEGSHTRYFVYVNNGETSLCGTCLDGETNIGHGNGLTGDRVEVDITDDVADGQTIRLILINADNTSGLDSNQFDRPYNTYNGLGTYQEFNFTVTLNEIVEETPTLAESTDFTFTRNGDVFTAAGDLTSISINVLTPNETSLTVNGLSHTFTYDDLIAIGGSAGDVVFRVNGLYTDGSYESLDFTFNFVAPTPAVYEATGNTRYTHADADENGLVVVIGNVTGAVYRYDGVIYDTAAEARAAIQAAVEATSEDQSIAFEQLSVRSTTMFTSATEIEEDNGTDTRWVAGDAATTPIAGDDNISFQATIYELIEAVEVVVEEDTEVELSLLSLDDAAGNTYTAVRDNGNSVQTTIVHRFSDKYQATAPGTTFGLGGNGTYTITTDTHTATFTVGGGNGFITVWNETTL